ncbi:MAG: DegV family protein [Clostridiales bacterium]|nr:DegV family protein [Clostridiales bacterium]
MKPVIISADSPIDFTPEQAQRFGVKVIPMHISLDGREYLDGVDITTPDLFAAYRDKKILPKTSAIAIAEYSDFFSEFLKDGCEVVHLSLSSQLSSTHQNAVIAASQLDGVYVLDTMHLSSSIALLSIKAAQLRDSGELSAKDIFTRMQAMREKVHTSFVLDTLTFMSKGGRCSGVTAFGANILGIRPMLGMSEGSLGVVKKYRGKPESVQLQYLTDVLSQCPDIDDSFAVICHSGISEQQYEALEKKAMEIGHFKEIMQMQAGCTISTHCGPNAMGILFMSR